jgi:ApaG protein
MSTTVTQDIKVTVRSRFEPKHSDPRVGRFIFSYRITITNTGREAVQLKRRHWEIRDGLAARRTVEGPGVVGETPTLHAGESYTYSSACDLHSAFGRMNGTYTMLQLDTGKQFEVMIPEVALEFPFAAN